MPYKLIKLKNNKYKVKNIDTNKVMAKSTTKTKAMKQIKLLNYLHV